MIVVTRNLTLGLFPFFLFNLLNMPSDILIGSLFIHTIYTIYIYTI